MNKTSFRAVICDLDGTLLDTLEDIAIGTNQALNQAGFPTHPVDAYRQFVGNGVEMLLRRAMPQELAARLPLPPISNETENTPEVAVLRRLLAALDEHHKEGEGHFTRPFAEVPELLVGLLSRNLAIGVFSNKPQARVAISVSTFFPHIPFFCVCGAQPGVPLKPDPTALVALIRDKGFSPCEVMYLGDSDVDMQTANNAGMFGAGASWGYRGREELRLAGADQVFDTPLDISKYINKYKI